MEEKEIVKILLHEALNYAAMMSCTVQVSADYNEETGFHLWVNTNRKDDEE